MEKAEFRLVRDDEVDGAPFFLFSWGFDLDGLTASLARVGQIMPLVLWPQAGGFKLICGYRRLLALRSLKIEVLKAIILPEELSPQEVFLIGLEDNLTQRPFNEAEKVLAVRGLEDFVTEQEILAGYMQRLGLPPHPRFLKRYLDLNDLGDRALDLLAQGRLDPEAGESIAAMKPDDQEAVLELIETLLPNRNRRREILTWLPEISRREGSSIRQILCRPEIESALAAGKPNRPQQEKKVRACLRKLRFPGLTDLEKRRDKHLTALGLPPWIRLHLPPHFEGLGFTMEIDIKTRADLTAGAGLLARLARDPDMSALLELG